MQRITFAEWWSGEKSLTSTGARYIGLDSFADFEVDGKILDRESYLKLADRTVENFYMDVNKENGQAYMVVKLEDY